MEGIGADAAMPGGASRHRRGLEGWRMTIHAAEPSQPVLLIADADPDARAETVSALVRRFGRDYQVLSAETAQDGLDALQRVAGQGCEVALVAADLRLPDIGGVEFLQRARVLHRGAGRVLLVAMDRYHTRLPFT